MARIPQAATHLLRGAFDPCPTFANGSPTTRARWNWNGPADRRFTRFRDQDLQRSIIEHFERIGPPRGRPRRHQGRGHRSHLRRTVGRGLGTGRNTECRDQPGRPDRHPAAGMSDVSARDARLPRRRTARFVALDAHYPPDWLDHVLQDARPTLIVTLEDGLPGSRPGCRRCASSV